MDFYNCRFPFFGCLSLQKSSVQLNFLLLPICLLKVHLPSIFCSAGQEGYKRWGLRLWFLDHVALSVLSWVLFKYKVGEIVKCKMFLWLMGKIFSCGCVWGRQGPETSAIEKGNGFLFWRSLLIRGEKVNGHCFIFFPKVHSRDGGKSSVGHYYSLTHEDQSPSPFTLLPGRLSHLFASEWQISCSASRYLLCLKGNGCWPVGSASAVTTFCC